MAERWEKMHQDDNRPWDLKGVTPMVKYFFETDEIGKSIRLELNDSKRILVPGCGQVKHNEIYIQIV